MLAHPHLAARDLRGGGPRVGRDAEERPETGGGTANGTQVRLWSCNGYGAQQWRQMPNGTLVNPQSGRCLDADAWGTANGTLLEIWDCGAAQSNQNWRQA